jgi:hypothetical protein
LVAQATEFEVGQGLKARVLDLAALIRITAETTQEKDKARLAILRRTLEEKTKK